MSNQAAMPKYLMLLVVLFITIYLATGMVQYRLVSITHSIYFSFAIFIYPLSYLISDLVTEVYGYQVARQLIWCGILAWVFAGVCVKLATLMPYPLFWKHFAFEYDDILGTYLRNQLSGSLGVMLGQFLNVWILSKCKVLLQGRYFWFRCVLSTVIGDAITITVALFLVYFGKMAMGHIFAIIFNEIVVNILYTAIMAFPAVFVANALKKAEKLDTFDYSVNFNPFKFVVDQKGTKNHAFTSNK